MTITTTDIMDTEALLRERLNGLRETFQREELERTIQRDRIREVAADLAEDHGKENGVDEILLAMGLPRLDLYVQAYVLVRWQQVVHATDMHYLRVLDRSDTTVTTSWRPSYGDTGCIGQPTLCWTTQQNYSVLIEDMTIHRGEDCYCEHLRQIVTDPSDLAAQSADPYVPDGCRVVSREFIGCSGDGCTARHEAINAAYAGR
jgi:hypothetical protein